MARQDSLPRPRVSGSAGRHQSVGEMVIEVGELHHPRELSGLPGRVRDPSHLAWIHRVGRSVLSGPERRMTSCAGL